MIAQGAARMLGGRFFGRLADRSSRQLMQWGALGAALVITVVLILSATPLADGAAWLYSAAYFLLALPPPRARGERQVPGRGDRGGFPAHEARTVRQSATAPQLKP